MPAAEESPAIRRLGQLFRLTEVHLWDDSYAVGAKDGENHWRSAEAAFADSHKDKMRNKPSKQADEGHLFAEDLELANLMGSLGLPVSFSTSKEKKNTANKGKKKGRQTPCEEAIQVDDAVRMCLNTEERDSDVCSMPSVEHTNPCSSSRTSLGYNAACHDDADKLCLNTEERDSDVCSMPSVEHTNPCSSSRTSLGYNAACHDDADKLLGKDGAYIEEQEGSGCSTICSAEIAPSYEVENQPQIEICKSPDNMDSPVKPQSPLRDNQAADCVLPVIGEMLEHNSVNSESRHSCHGICHGERLSTGEDILSVESTSHDKNKVDHEACPSAEPFCTDDHAYNTDSNFYYEFGDWRVVWDPFYSRYYFFNIQTQESTWCPPEGLEEFSSYCSTHTSEGLNRLESQHTGIPMQENTNMAGDNMHVDGDGQGQDCCSGLDDLPNIPDEELDSMLTIDEAEHAENIQNEISVPQVLEMDQEVSSTKKKKRVRRSQSYHSCHDMAENISSDIIKYWTQRYSLFSLFDSGIKMDEEGWFSVTPEPIAKHHASRVGSGIVIDCFTGVGGNAIQFATKCQHVIAVDIDPQKIDCAQHNASVYGANDRIDFIIGDFICLAPHLKGETAFMSPPWGGPDYAKVEIYDMQAMLKPCDGYSLFKLGTKIASRVVMFLPRNIDLSQLADMSLSVDPPWKVEVEKNFLNGKLKAITAYFEKQDG
ncbi:hypothetical protein ACP70R_014306 [Stipagrostis hirtigluma subsp. patula]